jgi:F420-0:gamma-glutamyl ligase
MGEGDERTPVALVRGARVELSEKPRHSPKISPEKCIYLAGLKLTK